MTAHETPTSPATGAQRIGFGWTAVALAVCVVVVGCSNQDSEVAASEAAEPTAARATTSTETETSTSTVDQPLTKTAVAIATEFLMARAARNTEAALSHLDTAVFMDWGPGTTYDTLELGLAWEDAFTVVHDLDSCESGAVAGNSFTVTCRLEVDSEVARSAGNPPGYVCTEISVIDQAITRISILDPQPGCDYAYWPNMFAPFGDWLSEAHPDTTVGAMYHDRISNEGLTLWGQYTEEFLAHHQS